MAKKTKDETIDLLYIKESPTEKSKKKRSVRVDAHINPNKKQKKHKTSKNKKNLEPKDDIINLDNEIIIGLTPKPEQKKPKKENKNNIQSNKKNTVGAGLKSARKTQKNNQNTVGVGRDKNNGKNTVGVNAHIDPKQNKKIKIRIQILKWTSICILLVGVIIAFMLSPIFNIKQINVEGISKLTSEEIISCSQIQQDVNIFKVHKSNTIAKIQEIPYVEVASITRELPSTLKITIKERIPQYIIEIVNGKAYIDSKGYILEISQENLPLPVLLGCGTSIESIIDFENTKKLSDEDCRKIEVINKVFEAAKNNGILTYITSIDITNIDDIVLNLDTEQKKAYFGDCSNANLRILYLKKMLEEEKGHAGEAYINGNMHTLKPKPFFREKI